MNTVGKLRAIIAAGTLVLMAGCSGDEAAPASSSPPPSSSVGSGTSTDAASTTDPGASSTAGASTTTAGAGSSDTTTLATVSSAPPAVGSATTTSGAPPATSSPATPAVGPATSTAAPDVPASISDDTAPLPTGDPEAFCAVEFGIERINATATSEQEFIEGLRTDIQPQLAAWPALAPTAQLRDAAAVLGSRIDEVIATGSVAPFGDEAVASAGAAVTAFCGEAPESAAP